MCSIKEVSEILYKSICVYWLPFSIFPLLDLSYQALIPLCEDDNQSMEIIQRLQKNLDILIQSMARVSSRSEMLGAIHQVREEEEPVLGDGTTHNGKLKSHVNNLFRILMVHWTLVYVDVRRVVLVKQWR